MGKLHTREISVMKPQTLSDIRSVVVSIVTEIRQIDVRADDYEKTFKQLNMDSLDIANILLAIEEKLDIKIPDPDAGALTSLRSIVEYVQARRSSP